MTSEQINKLLSHLKRSNAGTCSEPELVETHISWVILCDRLVYKIKKPIKYSFLDFSSLQKRKYYCEREVELNKRLTNDIYLDVQPVKEISGNFFIDTDEAEVIDYAVRMRRVDREKQMDILLQKNKVTDSDIKSLAEKIANFHKSTKIIYEKDILDVQKKFSDLEDEKYYLQEYLVNSSAIINEAINTSDTFTKKNSGLITNRLKAGFFRDCHGDLHSRNIFLLPSPQPFDCIEFNDDFREVDVLNEVAFLCMDLDAFGRHDLSELFFNTYNSLFRAATTEEDYELFVYYKSYRANIRAKVNSLRARSTKDDPQRKIALNEADKYLLLMESYIKQLEKYSKKKVQQKAI
jgi:uncharacterized protein